MGKINSIKSRVLVKNPDLYFVGCSSHMAHNAACKGEDSFSGASRFDVEDLVVAFLSLTKITFQGLVHFQRIRNCFFQAKPTRGYMFQNLFI
jgi:hypothetical protein